MLSDRKGLMTMSDDYQVPPPAPPAPGAPAPVGNDGPSDTGKLLAGFGYLTGIVALIAILIEPYKNERFVRAHALQALALWVVSFVASLLNAIPIIGTLIWLVLWVGVIVFAIMGAIKAFAGQKYEIPVVYGIIEQYI